MGHGAGRVVADYLRVRQRLRDRRGAAEHAGRARRLGHRRGPEVTTHLGLMALFSVFVSIVFATLMRDEPRDQHSVRAPPVRRVHRRGHRDRLASVSAASLTTNYQRQHQPVFLWLPVVVYMAGIFYVSAQSSPPAPGGIPDKCCTPSSTSALGVVVFRAVAGRSAVAQVTAARVTATMLISSATPSAMKLHQLFVPFRTADVRDIAWPTLAGASVA